MFRALAKNISLIFLYFIFFTTTTFAVNSPFPQSDYITKVEIGPTIKSAAQGSDNWPVTWADNDNLYVTFGDGNGFETNPTPRLSMGFAVVTGNPANFVGTNIRSSSGETDGSGKAGKKGSGIIFVNRSLYAVVRNANQNGTGCQLLTSGDYAVSWSWASWKWTSFGYCSILNFGKANANAIDNYIYMYITPNHAYNNQSELFLARVPNNKIMDKNSWEYFNGTVETPTWSTNENNKKSIFTFNDGVNRHDVVYNAPLKRYILNMRAGLEAGTNYFGLFEAPNPWGPWKTIYFDDKGAGRKNDGWGEVQHFPTKWISADGKSMNIVCTCGDGFVVKPITLTVSRTTTPTPASTPTALFGDINKDGSVNIIDVLTLLKHVFNVGTYIPEYDLNKNTKVDVLDIITLIGIIF